MLVNTNRDTPETSNNILRRADFTFGHATCNTAVWTKLNTAPVLVQVRETIFESYS